METGIFGSLQSCGRAGFGRAAEKLRTRPVSAAVKEGMLKYAGPKFGATKWSIVTVVRPMQEAIFWTKRNGSVMLP